MVECSKKTRYKNDHRYICNPHTGRYVLRTGPTGRKILRECSRKKESVGLSGIVKDNDKVYSSPPPPMNGVNPNILGLENNGNTCYFNSALQMFLGTTVVQNTFRDVVVNKRFLQIIEELIYNRINPVVSTYNPQELRKELSRYNPFFGEYGQQDCHECFVNLLYIIHKNTLIPLQNYQHGKILKSTNKRLVTKSNEKMYKDLLIEGYSLINSLFLGQLKSVLSCKECNSRRYNFENINNLSLSLPSSRKVDIVDCFMGYFRSELLEENIDCSVCNRRTRTEKKLSLWRFPKLLVLHLKRYTQTRHNVYERNNCIVEFGENLIFEDSVVGNNVIMYKLKCIVNHYGKTPLSGHYSTIIKHCTYGWVNMDDSAYYSVRDNKLVNDSVYIVLYEMI